MSAAEKSRARRREDERRETPVDSQTKRSFAFTAGSHVLFHRTLYLTLPVFLLVSFDTSLRELPISFTFFAERVLVFHSMR